MKKYKSLFRSTDSLMSISIQLDQQDKDILQEVARNRKSGWLRMQGQILLMLSEGFSRSDIEEVLAVDEKEINECEQQFLQTGTQGILKSLSTIG